MWKKCLRTFLFDMVIAMPFAIYANAYLHYPRLICKNVVWSTTDIIIIATVIAILDTIRCWYVNKNKH